jgi:hypothetical protein
MMLYVYVSGFEAQVLNPILRNPFCATGLRTSARWSTIRVFLKVRFGAREDCNQSLDHDQWGEASRKSLPAVEKMSPFVSS